jgi:DNA-binding CsgD family transcriptional regulator/tetratricopeptide (TPR) repeat protein
MPGQVFGRDAELTVLAAFLRGLPGGPGALVLSGPAGAGKTTLLRAAVSEATALGMTVLATQPAGSDVRLAFTGLSDLLGPELDALLPLLPPPQRRALSVALQIQDAPGRPPEPTAIAVAVRTALAALAAVAPVLVAVDDVQWLDPPSRSAVSFALRRLVAEPVGLLGALRAAGGEPELPLELNRARLPAELVPLGGLSLGALHRMLRSRLGVSFSHPTLLRIEAESAGNPFIALEIGRVLARRGMTRLTGRDLPIPDTLAGLVDARLADLPAGPRAALELVAVLPGAPPDRYLAAGLPGADLDHAVTAGLLEEAEGRLVFTHPLLASAVAGAIPPARRRALHAAAAASATGLEERARHRALAAAGPDAAAADELAGAGAAAAARGAPVTAAELLELSAGLTPAGQPGRIRGRLLAAAGHLVQAGETRAAAAVLSGLATTAEPGPDRAAALSELAWSLEDDLGESLRLLDLALAEAGPDPLLRARISFYRSDFLAMRGDLPAARAAAWQAVAAAERSDDGALLAASLAHSYLYSVLSGAPADEAELGRALAIERSGPALVMLTPPSEVAGICWMLTGRLAAAERALRRALARAEADGTEYWQADILQRLSLLASRRGDLAAAADLSEAGLELAEQLDLSQLTSAALYACGWAALLRGRPEQVRGCAERGLRLSRQVGDQAYLVGHQALLGSLSLALGDPADAAARLVPLCDQLPGVGYRPATQFLLPEAAEAAIGAGQPEVARSLLDRAGSVAGDPVLGALTARCRGALYAAAGRPGEAVAELSRSLQLHDAVDPMPVSRARTQLVLGGVQRRMKQRRAARETLTAAREVLEAAGAVLWSARAAAELARVSGRAPAASGELTETERRVAELIAAGLTNREVAAELFVTVRAVESTLTKLYAKLGVRSRTQLAGRLREDPAGL